MPACIKVKLVSGWNFADIFLSSYRIIYMCSVLFAMTGSLAISTLKNILLEISLLWYFRTKLEAALQTDWNSGLRVSSWSFGLSNNNGKTKWKTRARLPFSCCCAVDLIHKPKQECTELTKNSLIRQLWIKWGHVISPLSFIGSSSLSKDVWATHRWFESEEWRETTKTGNERGGQMREENEFTASKGRNIPLDEQQK